MFTNSAPNDSRHGTMFDLSVAVPRAGPRHRETQDLDELRAFSSFLDPNKITVEFLSKFQKSEVSREIKLSRVVSLLNSSSNRVPYLLLLSYMNLTDEDMSCVIPFYQDSPDLVTEILADSSTPVTPQFLEDILCESNAFNISRILIRVSKESPDFYRLIIKMLNSDMEPDNCIDALLSYNTKYVFPDEEEVLSIAYRRQSIELIGVLSQSDDETIINEIIDRMNSIIHTPKRGILYCTIRELAAKSPRILPLITSYSFISTLCCDAYEGSYLSKEEAVLLLCDYFISFDDPVICKTIIEYGGLDPILSMIGEHPREVMMTIDVIATMVENGRTILLVHNILEILDDLECDECNMMRLSLISQLELTK